MMEYATGDRYDGAPPLPRREGFVPQREKKMREGVGLDHHQRHLF